MTKTLTETATCSVYVVCSEYVLNVFRLCLLLISSAHWYGDGDLAGFVIVRSWWMRWLLTLSICSTPSQVAAHSQAAPSRLHKSLLFTFVILVSVPSIICNIFAMYTRCVNSTMSSVFQLARLLCLIFQTKQLIFG